MQDGISPIGKPITTLLAASNSTAGMPTLTEAFQMAIDHHRAGRLEAAQQVCEQILAVRPQHAESLYLLGTIALQQGVFSRAVELLENAVALQSDSDPISVRFALALRQVQRFDDAVAQLQRVLQRQPTHVEALRMCAEIAAQRGRWSEAAHGYRQVLLHAPDDARVLNDFGNVLQALQRYDEAIAAYQQAFAILPAPEICNNLGNALALAGQSTAAIEAYERAIALRPEFADAHYNLANILRDQRQIAAAKNAYRHTLTLNPDAWQAACNLGLLLQQSGEFVEAEQLFRSAIAQQPSSADAWNYLGALCMQQHRTDEAFVALRQAVTLGPELVAAWNNLGNLHQSLGQESEALSSYQCAVDVDPRCSGAAINLSGLLKSLGDLDRAEAYARQAVNDEQNSALAFDALGNVLIYQGRIHQAIEAYEQSLKRNPHDPRVHSNYLYARQYSPGASLEALHNAHRAWNELHAKPIPRQTRWPRLEIAPNRPLRIGLVSADLGHHPVGFLLSRFVEHFDHSQAQLIAYSDRVCHDTVTTRLRNACDSWCDCAAMSDAQLAERIEQDCIDILFDLAGHTGRNRLTMFARQPAPIQASWLGYVGSTGVEAIGYLIADSDLVPDHLVAKYHERVIRLPTTSFCYEVPTKAPPIGPLPALSRGTITFGSFNNFAKVTPEVVACWGKILRRLPDARLVLKYRGGHCASVQSYYRALFQREGIDVGRIELQGASPLLEMLKLYSSTIDLGLDTFPFTGGTTTMLAASMGVPVVTCPGETIASRQSLAVFKALGVSETIATDLDDYVERAVALANHRDRLAELRVSLRPRFDASPLADATRLSTNLLAGLRSAWVDWCAQQRPVG